MGLFDHQRDAIVTALLDRVPDFNLHSIQYADVVVMPNGSSETIAELWGGACGLPVREAISAKAIQFGPDYHQKAAEYVLQNLRLYATNSINHDPLELFQLVLEYANLPIQVAKRAAPIAASANALAAATQVGCKRKTQA
jgi:hypothetical protein